MTNAQYLALFARKAELRAAARKLAALEAQLRSDLVKVERKRQQMDTSVYNTNKVTHVINGVALSINARWTDSDYVVWACGAEHNRHAEVYLNAHTKRDYCLKIKYKPGTDGISFGKDEYLGGGFRLVDAKRMALSFAVTGVTPTPVEITMAHALHRLGAKLKWTRRQLDVFEAMGRLVGWDKAVIAERARRRKR